MTWLRIFIHRLCGLFLKRKMERDLEDEIRGHLDMQIEDNLRQGMSLEEAERAARRSFGGVAQVKEAYRDKSRLRWIEDLWQDLRYGVRILLKQPGFTAVAIITLALGIGVNTTIFSIANATLLRPLPLKDGDRIFDVYGYNSNLPRHPWQKDFSYPDYLELRKLAGAVVDLFALSSVEPVLGASGVGSEAMVPSEGEDLHGLLVTGTYFSALGGEALMGRKLTPEDDQAAGAHPVVVLSHGFWQKRFGAAPEIVGQTILLNGCAFTVVGVAEASFTGVRPRSPDVWLPLLMHDQFKPEDQRLTQSDETRLHVMGRLQPGVSRKQAEAALTIAFTHLKQGRSESMPAQQIKLQQPSPFDPGPEARQIGMMIMSVALGAVTLVMLIACLNVAGLLLARLMARQREIAVRLSLGASRGRLLRQLFTEGLLLAGVGGLAGLLLLRLTAQAVRLFLPGAPASVFALDWRVLTYTMVISLFTAVVVGLLPAWQTTRFNLVSALKQETVGFNQPLARFPMRSMLVVGQIALSLVLLIGAGLFARTLLRVMTFDIDPGFETKNISIVSFPFGAPGSPRYDETRAAQFQEALQERLVATPMVKDAVWVERAPGREPFGSDSGKSNYWLEGRAFIVNGSTGIINNDWGDRATRNSVAPNYFAAFGVPLLYGRAFTEQETRDEAAVIVINEALQRRHWPGENPVGKSIITGGRKWEIIGVTKDTRNTRRNTAHEPYLYTPLSLERRLGLQLLVRSDAAPGALAATLRTIVGSMDPKLKISVTQFADVSKGAPGPLLLGTSVASLFGILALALAVMGLYGVTAFAVVQRTHEIGVRMALGARSADVMRLVLRQGLRLVIIGVALGLLLSVIATRVLAAALYGISPTDPLTFGVITLLLGLVALLACWLPARRATKVDPIIALRCE